MVKHSKKSKSTKKTIKTESNKKKSVVKTQKQDKKNNKNESNYSKYYISAVALIIIIAAVWAISSYMGTPNSSEKKSGVNANVIASVNGVTITDVELQEELDKLPAGFQDSITKEEALKQLIDKELLLAEANKVNIDIDTEVKNVMKKNNLDEEQFKSVLASQGISLDDFKEQLRILVFLNNTLFSKITVSDEEIESFYNDNPSFFVTPETVVAKHILVSFQNRTEDEAKTLIEQIKSEYDQDNSRFCELVQQYSEDPGSKDNCGEYPAFSMKDNFVEEYKEAAFANNVGEARIAKTVFGYHLILTTEKNPESTLSLEEARSDIKNALLVQKQQKVFTDYIESLRAKADIVNCYETPENDLCSDTTITATSSKDDNNEFSQAKLASFAQCITDSGAKMYGAYWCSHCANQKEMFGAAFENIDYVECAEKDNPQAQTTACQEAGIKGYPTWVINGQEYSGELSFEKLSRLTGCIL